MHFSEKKARTLGKEDSSKKGSVDRAIKPLLDRINSMDNFYTTSSCAGRIDLLKLSEKRRKDQSEWLYITHEKVTYEHLRQALNNPPDEEVWFRMESAIMHVCCRTLDDAVWLLNKVKKAGFKHSGILSIGTRIIVEMFGSEKIETIVAKDRKLLVSDHYLRVLAEEANKKLEITRKRIKKFISLLPR